MATTARQDREFIEEVINQGLLEAAIEWIQNNLAPDEVFAEKQLTVWAEDNGYIKEE